MAGIPQPEVVGGPDDHLHSHGTGSGLLYMVVVRQEHMGKTCHSRL